MSGFRASAGVLYLVLLAQGCGGHVEGRSGDQDPGKPADIADDAPADENDEDPSGAGPNPDADTDLGECVLGPAASRTHRDCAWVADERCYTSREMACNCACPRSRNSQCTSGFGAGSNDRVWVSCE